LVKLASSKLKWIISGWITSNITNYTWQTLSFSSTEFSVTKYLYFRHSLFYAYIYCHAFKLTCCTVSLQICSHIHILRQSFSLFLGSSAVFSTLWHHSFISCFNVHLSDVASFNCTYVLCFALSFNNPILFLLWVAFPIIIFYNAMQKTFKSENMSNQQK